MWARVGLCDTIGQKLKKRRSKSSIQGMCGTLSEKCLQQGLARLKHFD